MKKLLHKVFAYGTLRDGHEATHILNRNALLQAIDGAKFPFPLIQLVDFDLPFIVMGNVVEADNKELENLDRYENVKSGLYKRVLLPVSKIGSLEQEEMWVYVAGPTLERTIITSGDWLHR